MRRAGSKSVIRNFCTAAALLLTVLTWLAFGQVATFGFVTIDDPIYVASNTHLGRISLTNFTWAWTTAP